MKNSNKILASFLFISFIVPSIAFASWWNPLSWNWKFIISGIFSSKKETPINSLTNSTSTLIKVNTPISNKSTTQRETYNQKNEMENSDNLTVSNQVEKNTPLLASCSVNTTGVLVNQPVIWKAEVSDNSLHSYSWLGTDGLNGSNQSITWIYNNIGVKNASVTITNSTGQSVNITCNNSVNIIQPPIQYTTPNVESVSPQTIQNNKQDQVNILTAQYNKELSSLEQQILNIKNQYYTDVANIQKQAIPQEFIDGQITKLTNEDNQKIIQIQLQEQQLYLNYMTKLNSL